jgi:hypothetical protein
MARVLDPSNARHRAVLSSVGTITCSISHRWSADGLPAAVIRHPPSSRLRNTWRCLRYVGPCDPAPTGRTMARFKL